jgi:hypothetical protein
MRWRRAGEPTSSPAIGDDGRVEGGGERGEERESGAEGGRRKK